MLLHASWSGTRLEALARQRCRSSQPTWTSIPTISYDAIKLTRSQVVWSLAGAVKPSRYDNTYDTKDPAASQMTSIAIVNVLTGSSGCSCASSTSESASLSPLSMSSSHMHARSTLSCLVCVAALADQCGKRFRWPQPCQSTRTNGIIEAGAKCGHQ